MANAAAKRYEDLGLEAALRRPCDFPMACREIGLIIRAAYARLPKTIQSLLLRDTLAAMRCLPELQTISRISSATFLLHSAEAALPRQKKQQVTSEFKHAMVACKRRGKCYQDGDLMHIPQDILVCVFSFLDVHSLAAASLVCWEWNFAATDDNLWQMQYAYHFGKDIKCKEQSHHPLKVSKQLSEKSGKAGSTSVDWRETFKRKYTGTSSRKFTSNRAICNHCKSIIWINRMACAKSHQCTMTKGGKPESRPVSPSKIVKHLLEDKLDLSSSESDDSDGDEWFRLYKLWAYPRLKYIV